MRRVELLKGQLHLRTQLMNNNRLDCHCRVTILRHQRLLEARVGIEVAGRFIAN